MHVIQDHWESLPPFLVELIYNYVTYISLYTLGRCIAALANKSRQSESQKHIHVPYRDSKLTRLLQDSLGGNSKMFVLATINPSIACSEESISTLRFADRAHQVRPVVLTVLNIHFQN